MLDLVERLLEGSPVGARALLIELADEASAVDDHLGFGRACDMLAETAFLTGEDPFVPLEQALAAFEAAGEPLAAARIRGRLEGLGSARFDRADLLEAEVALVEAAAQFDRDSGDIELLPAPELVASRARLQVLRRVALGADGRESSLGELARRLELSELEIALLMAAYAEHVAPGVLEGVDPFDVVCRTLWPMPDEDDPTVQAALSETGRLFGLELLTTKGIDTDVVSYLEGGRGLAASLEPFVILPAPAELQSGSQLSGGWGAVVGSAAAGADVLIVGGLAEERLGIAAKLAHDLGRFLIHIDTLKAGVALPCVARVAVRESRLLDAMLSTDHPSRVEGVAIHLATSLAELDPALAAEPETVLISLLAPAGTGRR